MQTAIRALKYLLLVLVVAALGGGAAYVYFTRSHRTTVPIASSADTQNSFTGSSTAAPIGNSAATAAQTPAPPVGHPTVRLWKVSDGPVAGFAFVASGAASTSDLYFIERGNGNVFDGNTGNQTVFRITNTLIPKTYEAQFTAVPGQAILRTLNNGSITTLLASFATPASTSTFPTALGGPTLPAGIRMLVVDGNAKTGQIFYLQRVGGQTLGFLTTFTGAKPRQLFSSLLGSWRVLFARGTPVVLLSPSDNLPGYAYALNTSGARTLIAGPLPGLQILPHPAKDAYLLSSSGGGALQLYAKIGSAAAVALPLKTIAEKCVWAGGGTYIAYCAVPQSPTQSDFLDAWYQGAAYTSDTWWEVDASSGAVQEVYTPERATDVHNPVIDLSGSSLAYTNGSDRSLYLLRIVQ